MYNENLQFCRKKNKGYWLPKITLKLKCQVVCVNRKNIFHVQVGTQTNKDTHMQKYEYTELS